MENTAHPFAFGATSQRRLIGVQPELVSVAKRAIQITAQDFGVMEGLRTVEQEAENIKNGTSKLKDPKDCKHCIQPDGFGHALDLVPWIDGAFQWDWKAIYPIAAAMQSAALELKVIVRWGGVWDRSLNAMLAGAAELENEVAAYRRRHGTPAFLDGSHYELISAHAAMS